MIECSKNYATFVGAAFRKQGRKVLKVYSIRATQCVYIFSIEIDKGLWIIHTAN